MRSSLILTAAAVVVGVVSTSRAVVVSLAPSKDNTLYENADGTLSNGAGEHFFVGRTLAALERKGLLAFDVAGAVPAGSTVNAATLGLSISMQRGVGHTVALRRALADWGESTSNAGAAGEAGGGGTLARAGDATWKHRFYPGSDWSTLGGDLSGTVSASAIANGLGSIAFASTAQLVADVQSMQTSPGTNYGWFVVIDQPIAGQAIRFDSRENFDTGVRPHLLLDITLPSTAWTQDADGSFNDPANWSAGAPNSFGVIATLGPVITAPRTVTVNSPATVGRLALNCGQSYTLAGAGTLSLRGLPGTPGEIEVVSGNHTIAAPLHFSGDADVHVDSGASTLALTGDLTAASGATLTKSGSGTLQARHIRIAHLAVNEGIVRIAPDGGSAGTSRVHSLAFGAGALDLSDNDLIVDYDLFSALDDVGSYISGGLLVASAASSATRLGFAEAAALGVSTFSGQAVDDTAVLVKFTFAGDTNLDGQVDITDLGNLATNWQASGDWLQGDFNYSGFIDITDLGMLATNWQAGVGSPLGPSFNEAQAQFGLGGASVPEPASCLAVMGILSARMRRQRM